MMFASLFFAIGYVSGSQHLIDLINIHLYEHEMSHLQLCHLAALMLRLSLYEVDMMHAWDYAIARILSRAELSSLSTRARFYLHFGKKFNKLLQISAIACH